MSKSPLDSTHRLTPIPNQAAAAARRKGYRAHPIDLTHERSGEILVDLSTSGISGTNYYFRSDNPPYYQRIPGAIRELKLRVSVAEALRRVNATLVPYGLELFVHDAFRPVAVQHYFYQTWMPQQLKRKNPELSGEQLVAEVEKYWARPPNTVEELVESPPPHLTGAAVDLTLRHIGGDLLEMGGLFDEPSELSHRDYFEWRQPKNISEEQAQANRRILHWAMDEAGFVGHPFEWWHFSIGDQLWARLTGAEVAYYAAADTALPAS